LEVSEEAVNSVDHKQCLTIKLKHEGPTTMRQCGMALAAS